MKKTTHGKITIDDLKGKEAKARLDFPLKRRQFQEQLRSEAARLRQEEFTRTLKELGFDCRPNRKITIDWSKKFLASPKLDRDIQRWFNKVEIEACKVLKSHGIEISIIAEPWEGGDTKPGDIFVAQELLLLIYFARKHLEEKRTEQACYMVAQICKMLAMSHDPKLQAQLGGKGKRGKEGVIKQTMREIQKFTDGTFKAFLNVLEDEEQIADLYYDTLNPIPIEILGVDRDKKIVSYRNRDRVDKTVTFSRLRSTLSEIKSK